MLTIAGGVILGLFGFALILWIISLIVSNSEAIGVGFFILLAILAVYGAWAFLDAQWPEIDWIKTAFALIGGIIALVFIYVFSISYRDSPRIKIDNKKLYKEIYDKKLTKWEKAISIFFYINFFSIIIFSIYFYIFS